MRNGALLTLRLKRYVLAGTADGFEVRRAMTRCGFRIAEGATVVEGILTCTCIWSKMKECWLMLRVLIC